MVTHLVLASLCGAVTVANAAETEEPGPPPNARPLTVAADVDNFPYSYRESGGRLTGFAVELFDAIARQMQLDYRRVELGAMEDLRRFRTGEFDLAQFHPRPQEGKGPPGFVYSSPVLILHGAIFVRKGERLVGSVDDIIGRRVRIATPTQGNDFALAQGVAPDQITVASSPDCLRMLSESKVDAVLVTRLTGLAQAAHLGIRNIEIVGRSLPEFTVRYCIAAPGREASAIQEVNEVIAVLHQSNEYEAIFSRWFGRYEPRRFTAAELAIYVAAALAIALIVAVWALLRQRDLRHRIGGQAAELAEGRGILAEAQQFASLGHWQSRRGQADGGQWSDETYRIFEIESGRHTPDVISMADYAVAGDRSRWKSALAALDTDARPFDLTVTIEPRANVRKTLHVRGRPVFDPAGNQTGAFGTVQDVSASHSAAEALRQSEQLLRALYGNLPIGLGVVDKTEGEWRLVSLNPEARRQFGLVEIPPAGRQFRAIGLTPRRQAFWIGLFSTCAEEARTITTELADDDRKHIFAVTVLPVAAGGGVTRCCFLSDDITSRRRADAELQQGRRLRAIGELVGGIAHEFNNLLTPILLNAELLRREWKHVPALAGELETIAEAARRSSDLTRRLLAFGRKTDRTREAVDLRDIIESNANLVRSTIDRRIDVRSKIPDGLPRLHLHAGDLHQIVLNLLLNARDTLVEKFGHFPPEGWSPAIEIGARTHNAHAATPINPDCPAPEAGWIELTVRDNGCGMPPDVIERIFEPFYSTKEVGKGSGLGLATVWHLLSDMGGRVDVESHVKEGTVFRIFLPLDTAAEATPAKQDVPPVEVETTARRILLVEDEEPIARVVTSLLKRRGHTVVHAPDGLRGWEAFSQEASNFDAVILDLDMPGISGQEFARRARALPYTGPLVVVSGRITEADRRVFAALSVDQLINKPFEPSELFAALEAAFAEPSER